MIVLDTTLLSHVYRRSGRRPAPAAAVDRFVALMAKRAPVAVPGIVLQELFSGVRSQQAQQGLEVALRGLGLLLADEATHLSAAHIYNTCRGRGVAAGHFDCLVAAHTIQVDGELFTLDDDFRHIAKHTALRLLE